MKIGFCLPGYGLMMAISLLLIGAAPSLAGQDIEQGGWSIPAVGSVEMTIRNRTGLIKVELTAYGSAPEGTETMNVTFGYMNDTDIEPFDGPWFSEGGLILFDNGFLLEPRGSPAHPWSNWTFKLQIAVPYNGDPLSIMGTLGEYLPIGMNGTEISGHPPDLRNLTDDIARMRLFLIARAFNETGGWGQNAFNITSHVLTSVLEFMIDEGLMEDPDPEDDDVPPDGNDGEEDRKMSSILLLGMATGGVILLVAAVVLAVHLASARSRGGQ